MASPPSGTRLFTLGLTLLAAAAGCEDPLGSPRAILLPITAIETPSEVVAGKAAIIRVTIQSGGCKRFDQLNAVRTAGRVTITAHGTDSSGPQVGCPGDIRTDIREYRAEPPLSDPFTVVAKQPDGSETTRTVRIR